MSVPGAAAVDPSLPPPSEWLGAWAGSLGLTVVDAGPDRVEVGWPAGCDLGTAASVVETAGSLGAALWWGGRGRVVGTANTTSVFREDAPGPLRAVAVPVHRDDLGQLWRVDLTDADGATCAAGELRLANLGG